MSKDYKGPISEESNKTRRTVENGAKHLQVSCDLVVVLCIREAVWLSGKSAGFVIWRSRVKSSIQLLTGFVLGFPKFNSTAALCSQLVCLLSVKIFKHFTFIWKICFTLLHITKHLEACNKRYINCKFKFNSFFTSFGSGAASILNIICGFVSSRRIVLVLNWRLWYGLLQATV